MLSTYHIPCCTITGVYITSCEYFDIAKAFFADLFYRCIHNKKGFADSIANVFLLLLLF